MFYKRIEWPLYCLPKLLGLFNNWSALYHNACNLVKSLVFLARLSRLGADHPIQYPDFPIRYFLSHCFHFNIVRLQL